MTETEKMILDRRRRSYNCDSRIHKKVCKFRPKEDYPQFMKRIISENCVHFKEAVGK